MKRLFYLTIALFCVCNIYAHNTVTNESTSCSSSELNPLQELQYPRRPMPNMIHPGMSYREYKKLYDHSEYDEYYDTKYSPFWSGFASFCITGLGQACCGEFWRGLAFWAGKWVLTAAFASSNGDFTGASVIAYYGISIWSIIDASRVAKIKSMYYSDIRRSYRSDVSVGMYPSLNCVPSTSGLKATPCMTLSISF